MSYTWLTPIMVDQGHCFNMCDWYGHLKRYNMPMFFLLSQLLNTNKESMVEYLIYLALVSTRLTVYP